MSALTVDTEGTVMVVGLKDGYIVTYDLVNKKERGRFKAHDDKVTSITLRGGFCFNDLYHKLVKVVNKYMFKDTYEEISPSKLDDMVSDIAKIE